MGEIFKIIRFQNIQRHIIASKGVKNINMTISSVKIVLIAIFSNKTVEFVVAELKRNKRWRKFFEIKEVPDALQISEFLYKI